MNRIIPIACAGLLTAIAGTASAQQSDPPSARVSYADLDLSGAKGRSALDHRIDQAILVVCGQRPAPVELAKLPNWQVCRNTGLKSAKQQLALIYGGAHFAEASVTIRAPVR